MEQSAWIYVSLTLSTVLLSLLVRNEAYVRAGKKGGWTFGEYKPATTEQARNTVLEAAIFLLLSGVSACRIAVGNDYWTYRENFKIIVQNRHVSTEFGFNYVVKALVWVFGYDNYVPIFGFFSVVTVFFFAKMLHDQGKWYGYSFFLFMMGGYYFNSLNTVRYYLVLAMALFSIKYVLSGEIGKFVLVILVAATFHKTVLVVIPAYLLARYLAVHGIKKWHYLVGGVFLASLIFGQGAYRFIIFKLYPYYENSHFDSGRISYANVAKCVGVIALCILVQICGKEKTSLQYRFYSILNLFGLVAFLCGTFVPEVTRIGYYLIAPQIFLIPEAVASLKKGWLRETCRWGTILAFLGYFAVMMRKMYEVDVRLLPYLNWIFN